MTTTPEPPYLAVIFTTRRLGDRPDYDRAADRMLELAHQVDGFLGIESAHGSDGTGITVSYWRDEAAIERWRNDPEHLAAQQAGRGEWYAAYELRVARVERTASFERPDS